MKVGEIYKSDKGFTLIEMMVAMVLALVGLAILGQAFLAQQVTYDEQAEVIDMQANVKIAMQMMSNEILMAGYQPSSSACLGDDIVEAGNGEITFLADIDNDGEVEKIRYNWSGTEGDPLTREIGACSGGSLPSLPASNEEELALYIQKLLFTYYDASDTSTATLADIRKIKIDLVVLPKNPNPNFTKIRELTSNIKPRNLGL